MTFSIKRLAHLFNLITRNSTHPKLHTTIDDKDLCLIMYCRKSLMFFGNETWKKQSAENGFDVTIDSFDGTEICELVEMYIELNQINLLPKTKFGLNRHYGLILLKSRSRFSWRYTEPTKWYLLSIQETWR